ncbi:MAG: CPBP family intramembrane metalloprotease [Oligoflexus sp.]|nr:CPBP family intramembrane metalloprotease [Oligoflexus sp.]
MSYNAGVSEEALFRDYLQPLFYESWQSSLWSNLAQATIFAAAHYLSTNSPWFNSASVTTWAG